MSDPLEVPLRRYDVSPFTSSSGRRVLIGIAAGVAAGLAVWSLGAGYLGIALMVASYVALFFAALRPAELTLGPDGFRITWRGDAQFVPWRDVVAIRQPSGRSRLVVLTRGKKIEVTMSRMAPARPLYLRMTDALARFRITDPVDVPFQLQVEGRDAYREASLTREVLVRVAEDPHAETRIRVRAAQLAHEAGEHGIAERFGGVTVDPELTAALEELQT